MIDFPTQNPTAIHQVALMTSTSRWETWLSYPIWDGSPKAISAKLCKTCCRGVRGIACIRVAIAAEQISWPTRHSRKSVHCSTNDERGSWDMISCLHKRDAKDRLIGKRPSHARIGICSPCLLILAKESSPAFPSSRSHPLPLLADQGQATWQAWVDF